MNNASNLVPMDRVRGFFAVFRYSRRALELVWSTSRRLTLWLALLTLIAGALPAAIAYVGALIVDAVVAAMNARGAPTAAAGGAVPPLFGAPGIAQVMEFVILEGLLVAALAAAQRGLSL